MEIPSSRNNRLFISSPENPENLVRLKSYLGPIEDYMSPQTRARLKGWLPE